MKEGPYTVESFDLPPNRTYYRVVGPTATGMSCVLAKYAADRHCAFLNAAFLSGQQASVDRIKELETAGNALKDELMSIANVGGWPSNDIRPLCDAWDRALNPQGS